MAQPPQRKTRNLSQYPTVIVITISFLAMIGYVCDVQALYRLDTILILRWV